MNGKQYSQPFDVVREVTLPSTDEDLTASTDLQRKIVAAMSESAGMINRIEIMKMQVEDQQKALAANADARKALADLAKKLYDTELNFLSRTELHSDDKWYVEKYKLHFNLIWLLAEVGGGGGDVMGGVGYKPTRAALSVFEDRQEDLAGAKKAFDDLVKAVDAFNRSQAGKIPAITDRLQR